jgi:hypothetical protein
MLAMAQAEIEGAVGIPLATRAVTWYDDAKNYRLWESTRNLIIPYGRYIDPATVVVTDYQGNVVPAAQYVVRTDVGLIKSVPGLSFAVGFATAFPVTPYKMTATAGFGTSPDYATVELPQINNLVLEFAAFLFQQRTPGAVTERSAGSAVTYEMDKEMAGLPSIVARGIRRLRGVVQAAI